MCIESIIINIIIIIIRINVKVTKYLNIFLSCVCFWVLFLEYLGKMLQVMHFLCVNNESLHNLAGRYHKCVIFQALKNNPSHALKTSILGRILCDSVAKSLS